MLQSGQQQSVVQQTQEQPDTSDQLQELMDTLNRSAKQTVVVVGSDPRPGQVVIRLDISPRDASELEALKTAINYYVATQGDDYTATYHLLANVDRGHYSQAERVRANRNLDTAAAKFIVRAAGRVNVNRYHVNITVCLPE